MGGGIRVAAAAAALVAAAAVVVGGSWLFYENWILFPRSTICGSPGGPPVTADRIRLKDGRYLAYFERGVPKEDAKYKIVFAHGFLSSSLDVLRASQELIEEKSVYMVGYDRAGYRESDPNPKRCLKQEAMDIEELGDALQLGSKFYVVGYSLGGHAVWASLKYIPGRLAGAVLIAPVINHRWPSFPNNLSAEAYYKQDVGDQWTLRVAYYAPWLLNWWLNQSWLPTSTVIKGTVTLHNRLDEHLTDQLRRNGVFTKMVKLATQQGIHESLYRDMIVMFGKWEFDPMDLQPPSFPVHIWQGDEDGLVPVTLQRHISKRLNWIKYHELPSTGHYLSVVPGFSDRVLKALLLDS